ncbi:hypothetical protein HK102_008636 [Quaeritorhiza haematococci]|nr:hypothetical protein HK102_008636 [Quaeritorhiza haematococci]
MDEAATARTAGHTLGSSPTGKGGNGRTVGGDGAGSNLNLDLLRSSIDTVDAKIVNLLNERASVRLLAYFALRPWANARFPFRGMVEWNVRVLGFLGGERAGVVRVLERGDNEAGLLHRALANSSQSRSLSKIWQISVNIGLAKKRKRDEESGSNDDENETPVHVHIPAREKAVYERLKRINHGPLPHEAVHAIYREIMSASISLQKEITIAFLGPRGSFSHQAATARFGDSVAYSAQQTIADVFTAVETGAVTYGLVPFENSTFGSVQQTLDRFIRVGSTRTNGADSAVGSSGHLGTGMSKVQIRAETYLTIHHCLLSNCPSLSSVKRIYSHPEAFGQCQKWIGEHLKEAERVNVSSTSYAAELASKEPDAAAICSLVCADIYGLKVLQQNIEDLKDNTTRFFIIGDTSVAPSKNDRTLLCFTVDHRQPGALCDALSVVKEQHINLTKIDSRPSGQRAWHYVFFIEMEGHMEDTKVKKALEDMNKYCLDVRVLGSYANERPQ